MITWLIVYLSIGFLLSLIASVVYTRDERHFEDYLCVIYIIPIVTINWGLSVLLIFPLIIWIINKIIPDGKK